MKITPKILYDIASQYGKENEPINIIIDYNCDDDCYNYIGKPSEVKCSKGKLKIIVCNYD